ncbi:MAG TPA: DUF4834 domain-containing protein [Mucilaginibacter sp.]|jgi:Tfp pilus assembly major pilin PilA
MEFLDFLFMAILVLYIIRSLARIVLPMLFQKVVNKAQQQQNYQQNYSNTKSDKIKVDYIPKTNKGTVPDSEGEFVDYEEIK